MIKYSLSLLFVILCAQFIVAQNSDQIHRCAFELAINNHEKTHPGYRDFSNASFDFIKDQINYNKSGEELKVKVVVHVVYANQDENIGEDRVNRVIESINESFKGENSINQGLRPEFQSVIGYSNISFILEHIEYVETSSSFSVDFATGMLPDNVKSSAAGGSDAWDPDEYLNIWVCNIQSGFGTLLGYAYPPSCAPNWPDGSVAPSSDVDGVVIHYPAFDTEGFILEMGEEFQIRGRAVAHEIGHYFGLRHIWGDGSLAFFGIPDCNVDDGISDTPNQGLPSGSCDPTNNSCIDASNDLPDMFENYMDYSEEVCQNTFTAEQVQVMRSSILNCRINILSKSNEITVTIPQEFIIYPNPSTTGEISLSFDKTPNSKQKIKIINYLGKEVLNFDNLDNSSLINLNISSLAKGVYIIKVENTNNKLVSLKKLFIL